MISPALHEELCDDLKVKSILYSLMNQPTWPTSNDHALQLVITVRGTKHFVASLHPYTAPVEETGFGVFFINGSLFCERFDIFPGMPIWQP